jgi:TonB family protein
MTSTASARLLQSFRLRKWAATFALLSCAFFAAGMTASAQFQIVGPAPISATVARQRIRTLLEKVDPDNRQQTIKDIFGLVNWYRDLLDEELIAAWQKDGRANLTEVMEPLADARVAAGVIEFSWRQQPQATFIPAYAPMLGRLMARYPDSAKPFFDDLLGSTATGGKALVLPQPEVEAVCRILLDMPDIRDFKKSALQILPHYRQTAGNLLDKDLQGDDRERRDRAPRWLADLAAVDSAFAVQRSTVAARPAASSVAVAFKATNADSGWAVTANISGTVAYEGRFLKVMVSSCVLIRPSTFTSAADIVGIGAGVSRLTGENAAWHIQRSAGLHSMRQSLPPGQNIELPPFTLNIPIDNFEIRAGDWLTFNVRLKNIKDGKETMGEVYAHWHSLTPAQTAPATANVPRQFTPPIPDGQVAGDATGLQALRLFNAKQFAAAKERAVAGASAGSAGSMYVLGEIFLSGNGAARDYAEAASWFRKAADAGHNLAMVALGKLYETGRGVDQDLVEAVRWYRRSAEAGEGAGMAGLGHMYEIAGGVQQDYVQAFQWYLKGAGAGSPPAMLSLGLLYENGHALDQAFQPTRQDYGEARKWYERAARAGDAGGMYRLALSYEIGKGGAPDRPLAMEWYRKAAAAGSDQARARLGNEPSGSQPAAATGSVSQPTLLSKVEPSYSQAALEGKLEGVVVLQVVVDANGRVTNPRVMKSLGLGLDEKAIEAVSQWKFTPGYKDGKPVAVAATLEVNFRLLPGQPADSGARPSIMAEEDAGGAVRAPAPPDGVPAGPDSGDPVIQGAREAARRFIESLPNFAAKRYTNRYTSHGNRTSWKALDVVAADVIFENGKESYRNIVVNGKALPGGAETPGSSSTGEIAAVLQNVMASQTNAVFSNQRPETVVDRAAFRYDYSVERQNSHWTVSAAPESYTPAYSGSVWIDRENQRVLRIEMSARDLPASFAMDAVEFEVDYDYVPLGDRKFLLPVHSETLSCARATGDCARNVVTFQNYAKFGAEASGGGDGNGTGGGVVGNVYRPGNGVSVPVVTFKVPPEYSQEAQNARRSGTVVLSVVVDTEGHARNIKVVEPLGMGLDQKAIETVQKWRFRPGYKDGRPVNVLMQVEVGFRVQ